MQKLMFLVASFALTQIKPAAVLSRDGGVAAPLARAAAPVDAGVPAVAGAGPTSEVEKLRKELNELKLRVVEVERAGQAKSDALGDALEKVSRKLEEQRTQLKQLTDAEARRVDADEAALEKRTSTLAATSSVNSVLSMLASGNTSGIEPSLRYAESVFTGNAQRDVQLARAALAQSDVSAARVYLLLAVFEAESQR